MKNTALKIGFLAKGFKQGTGPGSYERMLKEALFGKHHICQAAGACPGMFDLIHVVDAKRADLELIKSFKAPVIADFHDDYWTTFQKYPCPDIALRWFRQKQLMAHHLRVIKKSDAVVVHSQSVKNSIQNIIKENFSDGNSPDIFVVPYAVDLPENADTSIEKENDLIVLVGRDIFRKGFPVIIKALPKVLEKKPNARLVVIGDEYPHTKIAAKFMARGLPVEFLPGQPRQSLIKWYKKASVLVLPSYLEAFGIVLIEAMDLELPVIASNTGGIPEAIEDGVSGVLHKKSDPADLADKIVNVLSDKDLRAKLIDGGRKKARSFSIENMASKLDKVYWKLTEK